MVGASSCYASPLCDWLVAAACMSVTHSGGDRPAQSDTRSSSFWARRKRLLKKCSAHGSDGIQALVSSYNNNALSSLFESNNTYLNRKQRRLNRASTSGIVHSNLIFLLLILSVLCHWEIVLFFFFLFNLGDSSNLVIFVCIYLLIRASHSRNGQGSNV